MAPHRVLPSQLSNDAIPNAPFKDGKKPYIGYNRSSHLSRLSQIHNALSDSPGTSTSERTHVLSAYKPWCDMVIGVIERYVFESKCSP